MTDEAIRLLFKKTYGRLPSVPELLQFKHNFPKPFTYKDERKDTREMEQIYESDVPVPENDVHPDA